MTIQRRILMIKRLGIEINGVYIGSREQWLQEQAYEEECEYADRFALDLDRQTNGMLLKKGIAIFEPECISDDEYDKREREEMQKFYDEGISGMQ